MFTIANSSLVCPGFGYVRVQPPCINECSQDNNTCTDGKICCFTPFPRCGHHCVIGKNDTEKPGLCPTKQPKNDIHNNWLVCDGHECDTDADCPRRQKCCSNACHAKVCFIPRRKILRKKLPAQTKN